MKLLGEVDRWAALMGLAFASAAFAVPEQWLQYHINSEGRNYRWLELTTNAPPNVALPKLNQQPLFARWTTPMDPAGGRWICFDRTRKSGPCDRVYFDSTGNGRLDDKTPASAVRTDQLSAYFEPLKFVFKGEDGPLTYHLVLRFMKYGEEDARLLAASGCYYDGKVDLGGKKRVATLLDGNVNGVFNDIDLNPAECDRISVGDEEAEDLTLGRLLEVDKQLFQIEVARDGAFLKIQKAENVVFGQVRVPETISEFTAVGEPGQFLRKPAKGELTLPVGKYRVHGWTIDRKDAKGAAWKLSGSDFSESAAFEVTAAQPAALEVGEPLRAAFSATESKKNIAFSLRLLGQFGETVSIEKSQQRPRAPQLALASADGSLHSTNSFEFG